MSITTKIYNELAGSPFIIEAEGPPGDFRLSELKEWKQANNDFFKEKLLVHGAVWLRNFGVDTVERFDESLQQFKTSGLLDYTGGNSPRTKLSTGIYTSTEYPPEYFISLHNELSYTDQWPDHLFFCCVTAPEQYGNTLIADGRKILQLLDPEVVEMFEQRKVTYIRNLHDGTGFFGASWQDTFETQDKDEVTEFCKKSNIDFEWKKDGGLRTMQLGLGVATHPVTKEKVWFNQADQFHASNHPPDYYAAMVDMCGGKLDELPQHACFGDGSEMSDEVLDSIRNAFKQLTVYFPWRKGDVLIIDNMLMAHGRAPYSGDRKILVAMS
ncbi:TauD/TfdA family dioxygenase [Microbulbifer taiwanensis]|uniref:TauD/TfdA family dioxygenase n=1 Tax=Microbulbifer taiwanensis TaxID=986746 RepID=A0ABW1YKH2_9GAMM|nr:TauD/TfdA family dioxygenase [Microbulbifer taiwanensis]